MQNVGADFDKTVILLFGFFLCQRLPILGYNNNKNVE